MRISDWSSDVCSSDLNGLLLFMALLMLAAFWLLIWLWAGLFRLVGIRIFATLFESSGFIWVASATVVAIGLWIGLERGQVVDALRNEIGRAWCRERVCQYV